MWWPFFTACTAVILGITFFIVFRKPLSNLIDRVRSISRDGINVGASQKTALAGQDPRAEAEQLLRELDSALVRETEEFIRKEIENRKLSAEEAVRVLARYLAAAFIGYSFEVAYRIIWGSQLRLLHHLNTHDLGEPVEAIRPFYVLAASQYPAWYKDYSFEQWLGFLRLSVLIRQDGNIVQLTVRGREFLARLIRMGYSMEMAG